jgi:ABC-type polysaccharide/polyol phosphate transport system ATPase subunit
MVLRVEGVGKKFMIDVRKRTVFQWLRSKHDEQPLCRDFWALKDVSFEVLSGEKIALIGRNGAGKTVLLRVVTGIFQPTEGTIHRTQPITPLFRYSLGVDPQLSVLDNIYVVGAFYGLLKKEIDQKLVEILDFCELKDFLLLPVKNLSSGQSQRLNFSIFIHARNSFLAFDEATVFSDFSFRQKTDAYFDQVMASDKTILMTSHDLGRLERYCPKAIWLEQGRILESGPTAGILDRYRKFCTKEAYHSH